MSDEDTTDATESIRTLLHYNKSEQAIAALKYGMVPFVGFVLSNPNRKHITLLLNLVEVYGDIYEVLGAEVADVSEELLDELKNRVKQVEKGIVTDYEDEGDIITHG